MHITKNNLMSHQNFIFFSLFVFDSINAFVSIHILFKKVSDFLVKLTQYQMQSCDLILLSINKLKVTFTDNV